MRRYSFQSRDCVTWRHSSRMEYVGGGFLQPSYSFAGLESLDEAAGDHFFHVTKTVIITLNYAKIFQPFVCRWQSVDRGSGISATLSIFFFSFSLGSQHSINGVSADLQPSRCADGGGDHHWFIKGIARNMQRKWHVRFLCWYVVLILCLCIFWHSGFILSQHWCTVNSKTILCLFFFRPRSFQERETLPSQKKLEKHRNGRGEYIHIIVRGSWWRERYPKNALPVCGLDTLLMYFLMSLFLPAVNKYSDKLVGGDTSDDVTGCRSHTSQLLLVRQLSCWLFGRHSDVCVG